MGTPASDQVTATLDSLRESREYRNYEAVRAHVLRMKELEGAARSQLGEPSDYWSEELENFDYMLDASPLIVAKLRRHCHHVTGVGVYDYRSGRERQRRRFEEKLAALVEIGGEDLLVPESPALGGFGFRIGGSLYNLDTLKFYEALIAMQRGGVLGDFRAGRERRVVWEIGAGWGGLAYQFKSLCPNVTYVISDFPELFLFSAVYLTSVFPEARVLFVDGEEADLAEQRFGEADFIFIPAALAGDVRFPRLDLTMNMVSFQEMTTGQVRSYVRRAFELGSPYLYSLNRDRSPYNPQLTGVRAIVDELFWSHEVPVLPVGYTRMLDRVPRATAKAYKRKTAEPELGYKHLVAWRRVRT